MNHVFERFLRFLSRFLNTFLTFLLFERFYIYDFNWDTHCSCCFVSDTSHNSCRSE